MDHSPVIMKKSTKTVEEKMCYFIFYKFSGTLQKHKWENCLTIDTQSWGFRRNAKLEEYLTIQQLITEMAQTVSCGGNLRYIKTPFQIFLLQLANSF